MLCNISKQTLDAGDWSIMLVPIENISHTIVVLSAYYQRMASAAFVIKMLKHFDVYL